MNTPEKADDLNECALSMHLGDEHDTLNAGARLAAALEPGLHIWLLGDLGSGKTTLTRGMVQALGHTGKVKSPTYTLIEPYVVSRLNLYHFDFYRLNSPEEYLDAGMDEYFSGSGVCVVEWPMQARPYLPPPDLEIQLTPEGSGRRIILRGTSEAGRTCLKKISSAADPV